jgi:hypothetical protein
VLGKIARWKRGICPLTLGLTPKLNLFVNQRIIRMAMAAGAPLDDREPCRPDLLVIATGEPQALMDFVRLKRPILLGFHYKSQAARIATMRLPIQAWYSTATEDFNGFIQGDLPALDVMKAIPGGADSVSGSTAVSGNRAIGNGLKSELTTAIVVIDTTKIEGRQIGALADYVAMLALSQARSYEECQPVPTITNLFAASCVDGTRPDGITDIDTTYLRGLYKMDAGRTLLGERSSIAYEMKKDLGGY